MSNKQIYPTISKNPNLMNKESTYLHQSTAAAARTPRTLAPAAPRTAHRLTQHMSTYKQIIAKDKKQTPNNVNSIEQCYKTNVYISRIA